MEIWRFSPDQPPLSILIEPTQMLCGPQIAFCRPAAVFLPSAPCYELDVGLLLRVVRQALSLYTMTSSNRNVFRVTGLLFGEFTSYRWIPFTNASDTELRCFLWCTWINGWINNREAGELRRHRGHYDVTVICYLRQHSQSFVVSPCELLQGWVTAGKGMLWGGPLAKCSTARCVFLQLPPKQVWWSWQKVINWSQQEADMRWLNISQIWPFDVPVSYALPGSECSLLWLAHGSGNLFLFLHALQLLTYHQRMTSFIFTWPPRHVFPV